jgi:vanillate O-demethylase monooxygenase subunit
MKAAAFGESNYPRNMWWVAALSSEVTEGALVSRQVVGRSVVLRRTSTGEVAALEDRCPHRGAPLSLGDVIDDNISCRYHGLQFAPDGRCVHVPTQDHVPARSEVRAYPVREIGPLVWIWTGDPDRADEHAPPEFDWAGNADWLHVSGAMPLQANYMSLKENVLDLTHFGFVHANTFRIRGWVKPPDVSVIDDVVRFEVTYDNVPLPHIDATMSGLGRRRVSSTTWGRSLSPAIHEAGMDARLVEPAPDERTDYHFRILHITTPASPRMTNYWWFVGTDYGHDIDGVHDWLRASITDGFIEDKVVLEAIQAAADADPEYARGPEVSVTADRAGLHARRQLQRLLDREHGPDEPVVASDIGSASTNEERKA